MCSRAQCKSALKNRRRFLHIVLDSNRELIFFTSLLKLEEENNLEYPLEGRGLSVAIIPASRTSGLLMGGKPKNVSLKSKGEKENTLWDCHDGEAQSRAVLKAGGNGKRLFSCIP